MYNVHLVRSQRLVTVTLTINCKVSTPNSRGSKHVNELRVITTIIHVAI